MERFGLRHLRYFLEVADSRSYRLASARLHVAQSAVSRRVQELEQALGVQLFERTSKGVSLAAAGEVLRGHARRMADELDTARLQLKKYNAGEVDVLRLGFPQVTSQLGFFPGLITRFRQNHPNIRLLLSPLSGDALEAVSSRSADVAIFEGPPERRGGLVARTLQSGVYLLALPAEHPLARTEQIAFEDIAEEGLILFPRHANPAAYDALLERAAAGGRPLSIIHETGSEDSRLALVAAGMGLSLVSTLALRSAERPEVVYRPLSDLSFETQLTLAWRDEDASFALRRFRETAEEFFADPTY